MKTMKMITKEDIIRVVTKDGRVEDFPNSGDQYTGGIYAARQYIRDASESDLVPRIFTGTIVTDVELVDDI